ncbi:dihydroxy-acid dehydratase [Rhizobium sp. KVB221]|uniref:Dihydroxy-acid dehydratase n=1 Tax=Rhizobium setariae TaxID=2801340 RepID=A0A936YRT8_9HYPH|nr:dihydroxy-acid dehydratase [Rhizobium setariae]MBL0373451.1 dihydroxy-acid dehydratase [Rhizobium setariae]
MTTRPRNPRSRHWFDAQDLPGFVHRSTLTPTGLHRRDFGGRPVIGIVSTWSDINPCNLNLRYLAKEVRQGVQEGGGIAFELPAMSLSENLIKPTSFLFRNLLAMEAEEMIRGYPLDGVVLLGGCDKTIPGLLMGAASANVPTIVVTSGPSIPRDTPQGVQGTGTTVWRFVDNLRSGAAGSDDFVRFEDEIMTTAGHCSEMGTASSVAAVCEALGVALLGSTMIPAPDGRRAQVARQAGRRIVEAAGQNGMRPSDILTKAAFDNAITTLCALGGSTNVILHLLALAGRVGVDLTLDRFDAIARQTPLIGDIQPSGVHLTSRLYSAGGIPTVLRRLGDLIDRGCNTIEGVELGDLLGGDRTEDTDVVRPLDRPIKPGPGLAVLRGSLAPCGAVLKASAADGALFSHRGPAYVFESVQEISDRIDDPALAITPNTVLVLRGVGPVGAMMPEWGMLPIPKYLMEQGIRDMVRVSDARMSGTAYGTAVLHAAPEAAIGGPLALVETGDIIELNVDERRLDLLVEEDEMARRRAAWMPSSQRFTRGYRALYGRHVLQADRGCDFDFLVGLDDDTMPEGLFRGWVGGW